MATSIDFIDFVCDQIADSGVVRYRKMFGEYLVYVNDKPILLICNSTVYVKKHAVLDDLMTTADHGIPYEGSKEHYILDIDDQELSQKVIACLLPITPVPKKKKKIKA